MSNPQQNIDIPVSWSVDGINVEASLTRPEGSGPFPAIIMVAGSGPTDRNWNSPMIPGSNGSAAQLAGWLTSQGYVTLRYDKRASGPHVQENAMKLTGKLSMQTHYDELAGGVGLLAGRDEVDVDRIYGLGNSEGCIHVVNYQLQAPKLRFKGLILTAPPSQPIGMVAHAQIAAQLNGVPGGDQILASYDAAMADFVAGRPVEVDESLPEGIKIVIRAANAPHNLPFSRELWVTDLAEWLAKITDPVLVIIGKKDVQVNWQTDGKIIAALAREHTNITVSFPENANHVLKHEERDLKQLTPQVVMASYSATDGVLDGDSIHAISAWLQQHR